MTAGKQASSEAQLGEVLGAAVAHHKEGNFGEAAEAYRRALALRPDEVGVHVNLGLVLKELGRPEDAEASYRRALVLDPDHVMARNYLGNVLRQLGRLEEAAEACRQAVAADPDRAVAHNSLGSVLQDLRRPAEAEDCYMRALSLDPERAVFHNNLGVVRRQLGRLVDAEAACRRALELKPAYAAAWNNLAVALQGQGRAGEAEDACREALRFDPDLSGALVNLAGVLRDLGRQDESLAAYHRALELKPDDARTYNNMSIVLGDLNRFEDAIESCNRALAIDPAYAEAMTNLANIRLEQGRLEDAIAGYDRALFVQPDQAEVHFIKSMVLLRAGRYSEGWPGYEWRWKCKDFPTKPLDAAEPAWDGAALDGGTILLYPEQGLGDAIQFARYAPLVAARGGKVLLRSYRGLGGLMRSLDGLVEIVEEGEPLPEFDCHAALMSLPRLLDTTIETIPADIPYLRAEPERVARWAKRLDEYAGLKVGLVWAGSPQYPGDRYRSVGLEPLAPLFDLDGVSFFSLQFGAVDDEVARVGAGALIDLGPEIKPFSEMAAALENLDLLISVDTAAAHLAGALGRKCWMLLTRVPDWRWHMDREDSPWYPTHKLFRQTERGAWGPVVARVRDELDALASSGGS